MRAVHLTLFIQFYFTLTRGSNSRECIAECLNKQYEYEYEYEYPLQTRLRLVCLR